MVEINKIINDFSSKNHISFNLSTHMPKGYEEANGTFDIKKKTLFFNTSMLAEAPDYEVLFYLFHELRHVLQYMKPEQFTPLIQKSLSYVLMFDGTCYKLLNGDWSECRLEGTDNYLSNAYLGQPYELDANKFAYEQAKYILGSSENLDKLYSFWTPEIKLSDSEYEEIYEKIENKISNK